jgi:uncharacterized protein YbcC (UPF0753/DUF2309 family)
MSGHLEGSGRDWFDDLLHRLEHVLPAQAPIKDFVHHNTLHGFQHLPFREALAAAEAATGNRGYQPVESFRAYFHGGRIDLSDLDAALDETPELRADQLLAGGIPRRKVLLAGLLHDLSPVTRAALNWRVEEMGALERCQDDVAAETRAKFADPAAVAGLWAACQDALGLDPAGLRAAVELEPPDTDDEAADLWARHQVKKDAEQRLADLFDRVGHALTLRGLLLHLTGRDLMDDLRPYLVRHLAAHLDQGMAAWQNPGRARGFYDAWRESAADDPHFDIADLSGWQGLLERLPASGRECIRQELSLLGLDESRWGGYLEALAKELPGWSGMFLWRDLHPGYDGHTTPIAMADYLAVRLVLERVHAQRIAGRHFKTEASLPGLRVYLHHHPAELRVRLALYAPLTPGPSPACGRGEHPASPRDGQGNAGLPEWLEDQGHRLVREATGHPGEEDDADWLPVARLIDHWQSTPECVDAGRACESRAWPLFLLCQHLGISAEELSGLGPGAASLLACLEELTPERMGWVWLQAYERHYRQQILAALAANHGRGPWRERGEGISAQLVFCIDDREEGLRRHLEELAPGVETLGAAAHFNVPHAWRGLDDADAVALCPVVPTPVIPAHEVHEVPRAGQEAIHGLHVQRRDLRLRWKDRLHQGTRLGLLKPLLLSAAAAPLSLGVLAAKVLSPAGWGVWLQSLRGAFDKPVATRIEFTAADDSPAATPETRRLGFTDLEQADRVQALLRGTGLTSGFAPLVVIMGHASHSQNNPHGSAYNCGACAGRWSGPNARLASAMANRPSVRSILAERGIVIPEGTWFVGSEHDTCDDIVAWYDEVLVPDALRPNLEKLKADVTEACKLHALERCRRFMSAPLDLTPEAAWRHVTGRANDFSQARPELGHATNAAAFFGRRALSRGAFFDRRAFLISFDPSQDPEGEVLERHLIINGAVGAGISLEYYFSTANNERYGCGTKVMHNVAGLLGVLEGAASDLRTGLPRQMIEVHEAMRLLVVVEHSIDVLTAIYQRQPAVREIVANAWVQLVALDPDSGAIHRFVPGTGWVEWKPEGGDLPRVQRSGDWFRGEREPLPPALIEKAVEVA